MLVFRKRRPVFRFARCHAPNWRSVEVSAPGFPLTPIPRRGWRLNTFC